ncbi:MAG TPA: lanthionine synthetase C family protein [Thermoanaerobaculia bacterium]|nr:lanthionine synthetase C family protein [Thermoanaerobaculia bacterium]
MIDSATAELGRFDQLAEAFDLDASLAGGWAGLALFWSYLDLSHSDAARPGNAIECLARAAQQVQDVGAPAGLFAGYAGLGWVARHLAELGWEETPESEHLARVSKENVLEAVESDALSEDFDLVNGWVGVGVYLLELLPDRDAREALATLIRRLAERADPATGAWWTPSDLLAPSHRSLTPAGQFNLGVAHGIPAVIWLLAQAQAHGIEERRCATLVARVVPWLLNQARRGKPGSVVPAFVATDYEPGWCRSAWCYGDPGFAAALFLSADALGNSEWRAEALDLARAAAARPPDATGVVDACLCHGAAGLAHLFNRLYHASREETFRQAARFWFADVLGRRQPGAGIAGYSAAYVDPGGQRHEEASPGLLEGTTGVALALLAAVSDLAPDWDRMFLLSARGVDKR